MDWNYEQPLDDLLDDAIMEQVLESAGSSQEKLRHLMVETAERLDDTSEVRSDP